MREWSTVASDGWKRCNSVCALAYFVDSCRGPRLIRLSFLSSISTGTLLYICVLVHGYVRYLFMGM